MRLLLRWQPEPGLDAVEPEGRSKSGTGLHAFNLTRRAIGLLQLLGRCVARGSLGAALPRVGLTSRDHVEVRQVLVHAK